MLAAVNLQVVCDNACDHGGREVFEKMEAYGVEVEVKVKMEFTTFQAIKA